MNRPRRSMHTVWEDTAENAHDSTNGSGGNVLDDGPKPAKITKRFRLFGELLETEANYVRVLNTIIENFKKPLVESGLIGTREQHLLFGKSRFEDIRDVHTHILSSLEQLERRWTEKALVGQVFATPLDDFRRVYVPYFNQYDQVTDTLRDIMSNDSRVNHLILTALLKATPEKNPDRRWLQQAKAAIDHVLSESNQKRTEAEQHTVTIQMINSIDHFPAELVNSNRPFESKADFRILKGKGVFAGYKRWEITFFLFSSCITVAKRRAQQPTEAIGTPGSGGRRTSTLSRTGTFNRSGNNSFGTLQRTTSIMSFMKHRERKPYSHMAIIRFPDVRELTYLREDGIFFVRLRGQMSEECTALQIAGDTAVDDAVFFFNEVCKMINNSSIRSLELLEVSDRLHEAEDGAEEVDDDDVQFMLRAKKAGADVRNGSLRPASTLRRAVSNVSLGLYRMASKTSLSMSRTSIIAEH
ncbi:Protein ECT2 [Aphelenchoides fujianensis]|nr:Protein ECT2 [Aphelenchoides fujianensis]